ncbi:hypothetical protein JL720_5844 [Aureococcus anophagefferens]|nr:hypothetical protein JL720_5844 [Aureococcus anophagefferens]
MLARNREAVRPRPYLLSTVGWPLLSSLAVDLDIEREWGAPLAAWTLGPGVANATARGEPSLFLLMAPPSAASVAMGCGAASDGAFGFAFLLFVVVLRVGPVFLRRPEILGAYWAYTFPLAALATAATHCAKCGRAPEALAWALSSAALAMVVLVAGRMGLHAARVAAGADSWPDPPRAPKGAEGGPTARAAPALVVYSRPRPPEHEGPLVVREAERVLARRDGRRRAEDVGLVGGARGRAGDRWRARLPRRQTARARPASSPR